jgi:uncharacterized LabA/DUF88 family protein
MAFYPDERIAFFIDGSNLYSTAKHLDFDIDYGKMLALFRGKGRLITANYYTALFEKDDYSPLRPLIDWLDYNGYHVITKPAKEFTDRDGRRKIKGDMDMEIAMDMIELAPHVDHMLLLSGDGDFRPVLKSVQKQGVRVTVISTRMSNPPMLADELRRQCDAFIELSDMDRLIGRPKKGEEEYDDDYDAS